jgi:uncharacterized protein YlzI (FlbEa/FlbD family)
MKTLDYGVKCIYDDSLKGKKCIFADSMAELLESIEDYRRDPKYGFVDAWIVGECGEPFEVSLVKDRQGEVIAEIPEYHPFIVKTSFSGREWTGPAAFVYLLE